MASGRVALYTKEGLLVNANMYLGPKHRRSLVERWLIKNRRKLRKGYYLIISPTIDPDAVKENGQNMAKIKRWMLPREKKEPLKRPPAIYSNKQYCDL